MSRPPPCVANAQRPELAGLSEDDQRALELLAHAVELAARARPRVSRIMGVLAARAAYLALDAAARPAAALVLAHGQPPNDVDPLSALVTVPLGGRTGFVLEEEAAIVHVSARLALEPHALVSLAKIVRSLEGLVERDGVWRALDALACRGRVKLLPGETADWPRDAALCPPGPNGTRFAVVERLLDGDVAAAPQRRA